MAQGRRGRDCDTAQREGAQRPLADALTTKKERLGALVDLLDRNGIDIEEIGKVNRVNLYQGFYKDAQGESHHVDMSSIQFVPTWDEGPAWPVVDRAKPVRLPELPKRRKTKGPRTALIIPDTQIGYRRDIVTGVLDPFHDEQALDLSLAVAAEIQPDLVVMVGDFLDLPQFSKYPQEAGFQLTTQPAIEAGYRYLSRLRAICPEVWLFEGNHDRRLQDYITRNALASFGLRRAAAPDSWPVLSVPYLLRLEELGIEYVGGYPAGIKYLNDGLAVIHGTKIASGGSTAAKVVSDEQVSLIFGHVHRHESQWRTRRTRSGRNEIAALTFGCLCRTDGAVPSVHGSTDVLGRAVPTVENWQQGMGIVTFDPHGTAFAAEPVHIHDGAAWFRGQVLR